MAKYVLSTFLLVINVFFHEEFTSYAATCSYNNFNCQRGTVCCGLNCSEKSESCIGESCTHDAGCGGSNEYCGVNKKCFAGCQSNSDCRNGKVCCQMVYKCKENCLGEPCETSNDCGGLSEYCPNAECRTRKSDSKTFPVWLIVVLVIAILIVVLTICWGIRIICRLYVRYGLSANAGENYTSSSYWIHTGAGGGGGGC